MKHIIQKNLELECLVSALTADKQELQEKVNKVNEENIWLNKHVFQLNRRYEATRSELLIIKRQYKELIETIL